MPLLACHPRDLLRQVRDLARYEGVAPVLDEAVLEWAWNNYFASEMRRTGQLEDQPQQRRGAQALMKSEENR